MKEWVHANTAKENDMEGKDDHKDTHPVEAKQPDKGTHVRAPTPTNTETTKKTGAKDDFHLHPTDSSESTNIKTNLSANSLVGLLTEKPVPSKSTMGTIFRKMSLIGGTHDPATQDILRASYPSKAYVNSKTAQASANDLPFEMHAFEALLTTVMALETQEYNKVNAQVQVILGYFRSGMNIF